MQIIFYICLFFSSTVCRVLINQKTKLNSNHLLIIMRSTETKCSTHIEMIGFKFSPHLFVFQLVLCSLVNFTICTLFS